MDMGVLSEAIRWLIELTPFRLEQAPQENLADLAKEAFAAGNADYGNLYAIACDQFGIALDVPLLDV
jgi:hypothetical protein